MLEMAVPPVQETLVRCLQAERISCAVLAYAKTFYYLTGVPVDATLPQAFALDDGGRSLLVTNQKPARAAAGRVGT